jgi:hypothetical protein
MARTVQDETGRTFTQEILGSPSISLFCHLSAVATIGRSSRS